jgi:hypothetical protein
MVTVLILSQLVSMPVLAATPEMNAQFTEWVVKYLNIGLTPTANEIKDESKILKISLDDAQSDFDLIVSNPNKDAGAKARINHFNLVLNIEYLSGDSKSNTTRILGKKLNSLHKEWYDEREHRQIEACYKTFDAIQGLVKKLADRLDTEGSIANIQKGIPSGKTTSQLADEQEIRFLLSTFDQNEENPDFMPKQWLENLLSNKINPYITRYNASLGGRQTVTPMDKKNAHNILD